jgi:hypothetical protein
MAILPILELGPWARVISMFSLNVLKKLRGLNQRANYTKRPPLVGEVGANILRIEGVKWSA